MFFLNREGEKEFFRNQHSVLTALYRSWYFDRKFFPILKKQRDGKLMEIPDPSVQAWLENYLRIETAVRLCNIDTLDLDIFLNDAGFRIVCDESPIPDNRLNHKEWTVAILGEDSQAIAYGASRNEALCKALLKVRNEDEILSALPANNWRYDEQGNRGNGYAHWKQEHLENALGLLTGRVWYPGERLGKTRSDVEVT